MLVGVLAGLLAAVFATIFGEPLVQDAIDIEEAKTASAALTPVLAHISDWTVSRPQQRAGLFLAAMLYGAVLGTIFSVVFAIVRGRGAERSDWQLATRIAAALFLAIVLVPFLKYPANPPAVGDPDTITRRTLLFLAMIGGSAVSLIAALRVLWSTPRDAPAWRGPVTAGALFLVLAGFLMIVLPSVDEVPRDFPASLLWNFRLSSLGASFVMWTTIGVGYGILAVRAQRAGARDEAPAVAG